MAQVRTNFGGGAVGTAPTTLTEPLFGNAVAFTGATCLYTNTATINGQTKNVTIFPSGSGIRIFRASMSTREMVGQLTFRMPATGGSGTFWWGVGTTRVANVGMTSGRTFTFVDAAPATRWTGSYVFTAGQDYEADWYLKVDSTTATAGIFKIQFRIAGTNTVVESFDNVAAGVTANLGTALLTTYSLPAAITSSSLTDIVLHSASYDTAPASSAYLAPWFITSSVGPLGTLVHIGDSTSNQDGLGSTLQPAAYAAMGWLLPDIWYYGVNSKALVAADSNGKTTMQNIQDARAALPQEPAAFVIGLGTNGRLNTDATTISQVGQIMAEIGSTTKTIWIGISQATAYGGVDADSIRRNNVLRNNSGPGQLWPNMVFIDLDAYLRNGRDETWLWQDPIDANFAHNSATGYMLRDNFVASKAFQITTGKAAGIADFESYGNLIVQQPTTAPSLTGSGTLSVVGKPAQAGLAGFSGSGSLTVAGSPAQAAPASLTGSGTLSVVGKPSLAVVVALSGSGTLSVLGSPSVPTAVALTGSGILTASAGGGASGSASFTGSGTLTVAVKAAVAALAAFSGSGTLVVAAKPGLAVAAIFTGSGLLIAASTGPVTIVGYYKGIPFTDILFKGKSLIEAMRI